MKEELKPTGRREQRACGWICLALALVACEVMWAQPAPYTADPDTAYLFPLDEPAGSSIATNRSPLTAGANLVAFDGNPYAGDGNDQPTVSTLLGAGGSAGFGNCADLSADIDLGLGLDAVLDGGFTMDDGSPISSDRLPTHQFFSPSNTFTLEALVNLSTITGGNQEIISTDQGSANGDRGLQFRITSTGALEFNFVGVSTTAISTPIPTNGAHAFVPNEWFHAALVYDGAGAWFYWTRLDSGATNANLIDGPLAEAVDIGDDMLLVVGNEGRVASGGIGSTEGLSGLIDEVRISSTVREANEFVFRSTSVLEASGWQDPNVPANALDGDLGTRWSAQGDGQWITFDLGRSEVVESVELAFYQPGSPRDNFFDVHVSNDNTSWLPVLTNAIGTSASLASFDVIDFPARYVRIVGHGNSENDFNSITEAVIHRAPPVDSDKDGLPDVWEDYYFMDLDEVALGDPDADTLSNFQELFRISDPTQANGVGDSDNDGLPDTWEQMWFGNLDQTATGDPDREGVNNLVESQNGSNPTNPNSVPGDTDGDSLPDAWELANLGTMAWWAYDDPDSDVYNNVAERVGGTSPTNAASHPSWISPRVALLSDSVVVTDACLMPSGSAYGRAINGVSFQHLPVTFNGHQYIAWYNTQGSDQSLWLGRRSISGVTLGAWEMFDTGSNLTNGDENAWDAHNVIAIGISHADGTLHVSWDHHGHTLRYRRSVVGLCTTNLGAWGPGALSAEQNWLVAAGQTITSVTYPRFFNTSSGDLRFVYRTGSTSAGDQWLHNYQPASLNWTTGRKFSAKEGTFTGLSLNGGTFTSTSRNAYENGYNFGQDGTLHHTWTYREATSNPSNHDIDYAYSTDGGVTWRNNAGVVIADTTLGQAIRVDSPGITVKVIDMRQRLINQQAQCVDNDGRVHVLMLHRRVEPGFEWQLGDSAFSTGDAAYYHYFRDPGTGVWSQRRLPVDISVGSRPKIGFDAAGNVYAVYVGGYSSVTVPGYTSGNLAVASASKASQYSDWEVLHVSSAAMDGEPLIDQARLLADNILSVFVQETGPTSSSATGTPLHVIDFVVGVAEPDLAALSLSLNFLGPDVVIVVPAQSGFTYQLRRATTLSPANWTSVGTARAGVDGLLALPDPNGRQPGQRFYSVVRGNP